MKSIRCWKRSFVEASTKKALDAVLQLQMKSPKLNQLQDSIGKLKAQELWHRQKTKALSTEERSLQLEANDFLVTDKCRDIQDKMSQILQFLDETQPIFESFNI